MYPHSYMDASDRSHAFAIFDQIHFMRLDIILACCSVIADLASQYMALRERDWFSSLLCPPHDPTFSFGGGSLVLEDLSI